MKRNNLIACLLFAFLFILNVNVCFADLYVNILAVNGTDDRKEKDVEFYLPEDLSAEDILDTAGLELEYDVNKGAYFVKGKITLEPKETKTFKVLVRDVWQFDDGELEEIKDQINFNYNRVTDTEYAEIGTVKKDSLLSRLDHVIVQHEQYADNIEARIANHRVYADEVNRIREKGLSVKYWRAVPPKPEEAGVFTFIAEIENPLDIEFNTKEKKFYLPTEVLPEHLTDLQGFEYRFDIEKGQPYLVRDENLRPKEVKRYPISIIDIWNIKQADIENLKMRARDTYQLLEATEYVNSADYLMVNIKKNLETIETSQATDKNISEHVSAYRTNAGRFQVALDDVETMEEQLEAVRENLERSKVKNVLKKIRSLKDIGEIAASMFTKPSVNKAWKIIIGIVIFVGIYTILHFAFWGKKTKLVQVTEEEVGEEKEEKSEKKETEKV